MRYRQKPPSWTPRNRSRQNVGGLSLSAGSAAQIIFDPATLMANYRDGDPINSIVDKVGGSITLSNTGSARPTFKLVNGRPLMRFAGGQNLFSGTSAFNISNTNFSIVIVCDISNYLGGTGNKQSILAAIAGSSARNIYLDKSTGLKVFDGSPKGGYGGLLNAGSADIITIWGNASNLNTMVNGVYLVANPALLLGALTQIRLGQTDALTQSMIGDLLYVEMYNTAFADQAAALVNENRIRAQIPYPAFQTSKSRHILVSNSLGEGVATTARDKRIFERAFANSSLSPADYNFIVRSYGGATTANFNAATQIAQWIYPHISGNGANQFVWLWDFTNSLSGNRGVANTHADLVAAATNLKNIYPAIKIIVPTCIARASSTNVNMETDRLALNALVMANTAAISGQANCYTKSGDMYDYVVDVAALPEFDSASDLSNGAVYDPDQIHLIDNGANIASMPFARMINATYSAS